MPDGWHLDSDKKDKYRLKAVAYQFARAKDLEMRGISIIIPLYNKQETIENTILSLLNLTDNCEHEIIVVDDGSTDRSLEFARRYLPAIRILEQENSGPSVARNHGANHAKYQYLIFLDADDELRPGCLDEHFLLLTTEQSANISFVSFSINNHENGTIEVFDMKERIDNKSNPATLKNFDFHFISFTPAGCFCISKYFFKEIGGFDKDLRLMEITDFLFRAFSGPAHAVISNKPLIEINRGTSESQFRRAEKDAQQYFQFANNILNIISPLEPDQRRHISQELIFTINKLWKLKKYKEVYCILERYDFFMKRYDLVKPSIKISTLSRIFARFQ